MHRSTNLAAVLALTCLGAHVLAEDAFEKRGEGARHADCCATAPCCPDNYCKKPLPCIPCPNWCGTADNYCKKPLPCVPCPDRCGCPDNYCKKPLPNLCLTRLWQFYRCPPCECERPADAKPPVVSKPPTPSQPKPLPQVK
jgi:hypothetical protein